jgi:hypothetical protein
MSALEAAFTDVHACGDRASFADVLFDNPIEYALGVEDEFHRIATCAVAPLG